VAESTQEKGPILIVFASFVAKSAPNKKQSAGEVEPPSATVDMNPTQRMLKVVVQKT
jgi:hypothetical protein